MKKWNTSCFVQFILSVFLRLFWHCFTITVVFWERTVFVEALLQYFDHNSVCITTTGVIRPKQRLYYYNTLSTIQACCCNTTTPI